jgi:hypothetical protein
MFPADYKLNKYKENYNKFKNIHKNIPEIISWEFENNYYVQKIILDTIDNWRTKENIKKFFSVYLSNYY